MQPRSFWDEMKAAGCSATPVEEAWRLSTTPVEGRSHIDAGCHVVRRVRELLRLHPHAVPPRVPRQAHAGAILLVEAHGDAAAREIHEEAVHGGLAAPE